MMHSVNSGNALPFFSSTKKQLFKQISAAGEQLTGLISESGEMIPFQVIFNAGGGSPTWAIINALNTSQVTGLPSNLLSKTTKDGVDYVTYNGGDIGTTLACGDYYFIQLSCNGTDVFSEVFRIELDGGSIPVNQYQVVRLEWTNDKNLDKIFYENGYTQHVYLKGYFDRLFIERNESVIADGFGNETVADSRTVEKMRFEAYPVHEQQLIAFELIRDCNSVKVRNVSTNEVVDTKDFKFTYEPVGNSYYKGIFTFQVVTHINQKC